VIEHGFGQVAVRVQQGDAFPGNEVLPDEIEKESALSGAGLPDDVEMAAALLRVEHDSAARMMGADAKLLTWCCHGRKGAGVPCAPQLGHGAGSTRFPEWVRRGYMASRRCA